MGTQNIGIKRIGLKNPRIGSAFSWIRYWATRIPSGLTATVISTTRIDLAWVNNGIADYDGIKIYWSTDGINYTLKDTITILTSYSITAGLVIGTTYYFYVMAYKGVNLSPSSNTASQKISTLLTGLLAHYKLSDVSDSYGTYTLTNNNGVTFVSGKLGNCATLGTGNANKSLTVNSAMGMTYATSKSIVGWFKLIDTIPAATTWTICSFMFASNPGNYVRFGYTTTLGGHIITMGTGTNLELELNVGEWYHFCITWDNTGNSVKFYLNRILLITDPVFSADYSAQVDKFAIGNFVNVQHAPIMADEVAVWNKILTQAEVTESYNGALGIAPYFNNEDANADNVQDLILRYTAYCWFSRPKALYNAGLNKTWIGQQHNNGTGYSHNIVTLNNATGVVSTFKIGTVLELDDHDEPTILARASDNKLFTCYSEHAGPLIRYRLSTNALDASAWGAETAISPNGTNTYTYSSCFQVVNGDIYIFYRDTDLLKARWCYIKSTDGGVNFGTFTQYSADEGTGATYNLIYQNKTNKDIIHFIGSPHPNEGLANNKVIHFYFNAGTDTWHKSDGTDITADLPLEYPDATTIFAKTDPEQVWIESIMLDSNGYPRVLMTYFPDIDTNFKLKYLYYTEWNGSSWSTPYEIHKSLDRDISSGNPRGEISYPPLSCFDRGNINRIIACKEVGGVCEVFLITRISANNFTSVQITSGSTVDQWRPFTTEATKRNVFWLNKEIYLSYNGVNNFKEQLITKTI